MEHADGPEGGPTVIPQLLVTVLFGEAPELSTTIAVKLKGPEAVGVPVMVPDEVLRVRPVGKVPELIEKV